MKKPKEPRAWKYPRLYYQSAPSYYNRERIRIIYPDGKSEWVDNVSDPDLVYRPCWAGWKDRVDDYGKNKTPFLALKAMRTYDRTFDWPKADFLGEIK